MGKGTHIWAILGFLARLLLMGQLPTGTEGGWIDNTGTADNSIVSGSSGDNLACPNNAAWTAVDGIVDFGCAGATPGQPLAPGLHGTPGGWNAAPPGEDEWLTFDFGKPVTLDGFRYSGGGDGVHDAKGIVISVGASKNGPWNTVDKFEGQKGKGKANTWSLVWQEFEFSSTTSQHWKFTATSPRFSEWQIWVGEIQFHQPSNWGWIVIALLVFGGGGYFGGGYLYNKNRGRAAIPHERFWNDVLGLVLDGLNYARGKGRSGMSYQGSSSRRAIGDDSKRGKEKKQKKEAKAKQGKQGRKTSTKSGRQRASDELLAAAPDSISSADGDQKEAKSTASGGGGRWVHIPA